RLCFVFFFFFSSRRRHTRFSRDWSSDVCSSDLGEALRQRGDRLASVRPGVEVEVTREPLGVVGLITPWNFPIAIPAWKIAPALRSEERRVGKECRYGSKT